MDLVRNVKKVKVGNLTLGDGNIYIQSMLNAHSSDFEKNIAQGIALEKAGCEIVRLAVPNLETIPLIYKLKENLSIPVVADIHFDYKLALESISAGIDKVRINPGNIGDFSRVQAVAKACLEKKVPIRIGVNSGSLEKEILAKYGAVVPEALVESALGHVSLLEKCDFDDIVISIKSSNVKTMVEAYRLLAQKCNYPLHLGVTEAGTAKMGIMKSAIGIGSLLLDGIGETIRVSLTADPVEEIYAAKDILKAIGLKKGVNIVSCPTCGRTEIDIIRLANIIEEKLADLEKDISVAVMGCVVNGPGEAKEADIGIAGGKGCAVIFKKGNVLRKVAEEDIISELFSEIDKL